MKLYLDNCCLHRPFDNQADPRIHLEAEAVKTILSLCEEGTWQLVGSDVLIFEIKNSPDVLRSHILNWMTQLGTENISLSEDIRQQAKVYETAGLQAFDALHLACASGRVDVFLTTDDKFRKKAQQIPDLAVKVANPLQWLEEVLP